MRTIWFRRQYQRFRLWLRPANYAILRWLSYQRWRFGAWMIRCGQAICHYEQNTFPVEKKKDAVEDRWRPVDYL